MAFQLTPATPTDLPTLITIYLNAFGPSLLHKYAFHNVSISAQSTWLHSRFLAHLSQPQFRFLKAVDPTTGAIAGWIRWTVPHAPSETPSSAETDSNGAPRAWPVGADAAVLDAFFGGLERFKKKWVVDEDMYVVGLLITDPAYQRRGVGTALLREGLERADREGRKTYLEATDVGKPVYDRLGFAEVDVLDVEVGDEMTRNWIMIRDPLSTFLS